MIKSNVTKAYLMGALHWIIIGAFLGLFLQTCSGYAQGLNLGESAGLESLPFLTKLGGVVENIIYYAAKIGGLLLVFGGIWQGSKRNWEMCVTLVLFGGVLFTLPNLASQLSTLAGGTTGGPK